MKKFTQTSIKTKSGRAKSYIMFLEFTLIDRSQIPQICSFVKCKLLHETTTKANHRLGESSWKTQVPQILEA